MKKNYNLLSRFLLTKVLFLTFFLLFFVGQTRAQSEKEKTLLEIEQQVASGTLSYEDMYKQCELLMWEYRTRDVEKNRLYFKKTLSLAQEHKDIEREARCYKCMGSVYDDWKINDSAMLFFDHALKLLGGKNFYREESSIYDIMGVCLNNLNKHEEALNSLFKALELNDKDKAQLIANKEDLSPAIKAEAGLFVNIGNIYFDLLNDDKALEYLLRTKKIMDNNPNIDFSSMQHKVLGNLSEIYMDRFEYDKAFPLIEKSYELASAREEFPSMVHALKRLADYYSLAKKDHQKAVRYSKEALEIAERIQQPYLINLAESVLESSYMRLGDYKKALYHAENILSRIDEENWEEYWEELEAVYGDLIIIYALLGDLDNSEEFLVRYHELYQKISDENLHSALQEMEVKYDVQQKELEIAQQKAKIAQQRNRLFILIGGLAAAGLLLTLLTFLIRQRNRRNRELTEMNAIKDKFFSIISHDLKNPVLAQHNALQFLAENADQWDVNTLSNYYGALLKSSDDLVELLKNLLNWSLMQSGRNTYNPTMFNLVAALQPDINIVRSMAERKNIAFETQLPATALVTADEDMLKTVVRNLLANAVKFTEPGGTVTLEIVPDDDGGTGVARNAHTVSISDTGVGMSEVQINRLFKLDSAISQPGTAGEHGTGLGLIVCKEMLEKHGAKLNLQSEKGKGSWFEFDLGIKNYELRITN